MLYNIFVSKRCFIWSLIWTDKIYTFIYIYYWIKSGVKKKKKNKKKNY